VLDPDSTVRPALGTTVSHPRPHAALLTVKGDVDTLTAPALDEALTELLTDSDDHVLVLDLTAVTYLASSGLAALVKAVRQAAERGLRLRMVSPSRAVGRPLSVTGSDKLFEMHESVDAALAGGD
jgi:anti-sigma B factor antagonist